MNLDLTAEQVELRDAARGILARHSGVAAARDALEGGATTSLWPTVAESGWAGLLVGEDDGGVDLGVHEAALIAEECGRTLASVPLLGHLGATLLLSGTAPGSWPDREATLAALAGGERRAVLLAARPPGGGVMGWTVEPRAGLRRADPPRVATVDGATTVHGTAHWVPDAPGADLLVVVSTDGDGRPTAVLVEAGAPGVDVHAVRRYDATRSLGHVTFDAAPAVVLPLTVEQLQDGWYVPQVLLAADSLGAAEATLEIGVRYAKDRFAFGRAIGSYQGVKHGLVESLRLVRIARSLVLLAAWSHDGSPERFAMVASAARAAADRALGYASRRTIFVHGGIGATWEHDAPLYYRRAQLSRLLLGGTDDAIERVADELLRGVPASLGGEVAR